MQTRVMVLVFCPSYYDALHLYEISQKYLKRFFRYRADTCVRAIINKVCKPELWFLCSAHPIIVLYICMKFLENISNDFLRYRVDTYVWWKWPFSIFKGQ